MQQQARSAFKLLVSDQQPESAASDQGRGNRIFPGSHYDTVDETVLACCSSHHSLHGVLVLFELAHRFPRRQIAGIEPINADRK